LFQDAEFRFISGFRSKAPKTHWRALAALRNLENRLPVVWVRGNHDGPFAAVEFMARHSHLSEPVGFAFRSGDKRVMVTHGKEHIGLDRDPRARVTNREAVEKLRDQWAGYDNHGLREAVAVARGAIAYSRIEKFDAAICGHTHGPFCGTLGGFPYANCGSWTKGNPATYVVVDNGWMGLVEYKSG
jgi:UDP-2,3-diacylglucosamine pyrophosphatase LpxH